MATAAFQRWQDSFPSPEQALLRQCALAQAADKFLDGHVEGFAAELVANNRRLSVRLRRAYRALCGR